MGKITIKNPRGAFITVIFLVIVLTSLSIFTFFYQKNSKQLSETVNELTDNHSSILNIDQAIQLLYAAENNSRMYILYKDTSYAHQYKQQLTEVAALLDSINTENKSVSLKAQIKDKEYKTGTYIQARLLFDSILSQEAKVALLPGFTESLRTIITPKKKATTATDTSVNNHTITKQNKKGLFKRLKEAIVNKPKAIAEKNLIIKQRAIDSIMVLRERELQRKAIAINDQSVYIKNIRLKEKALLQSNHQLFGHLQQLLAQLKQQSVTMQQERNAYLNKKASTLGSKLKANNTYLLLFGLLLAGIIIYILQQLFRNSLQLKKAKEEAEEYARLKNEFAETMSHEIRTPLHSIYAFAHDLSANQTLASQHEIVDAIKLSSHMLMSVVNNILDYTKMEKGKLKLTSVPFNPKSLLLEVLAGMQLLAKKKNIQLVKELSPTLDSIVLGDAFQLRQLLVNLLSNALKYTNEGIIKVEASLHHKSKHSADLLLAVKDTGIGIDDEKKAHLFDAYVTTIHRREIKEGSTGLGLSIVKKVIDLHKGKIKVDSLQGKGTTFTIELSYKIPDAQALHMTLNQPQDLSVLIVDNDILNTKYLELILNKKGYKTTSVHSGEEALSLIEQNNYQLLLTDISMPGMSGLHLAAAIRALKDQQKAQIPIVAITGYEEHKNNNKEATPSINAWLVKPFESQSLYTLIHKLLNP